MTSFPAVYADLQPAEVWRHFGALNSIPRPSGREEAARAYVQKVAEAHQALWKTDARGNICVRVPPRRAPLNAPVVVLQSHLDMVCQKRPDVVHNFDTDPIVPHQLGDKIYASGTTLGADNGMGAAMMLAVLTSPELTHGPLELLFTVEEETGLFGAAHLDPQLVRGRLLINLDSEDPDEITIGCAGGATMTLHLPFERQAAPPEGLAQIISVEGLQGGHSGIQIAEPLGNAIRILGEIVNELARQCPGLRLVSFDGGTAHNAIPRDATATIRVPSHEIAALEAAWAPAIHAIESRWRGDEPGLRLHRENSASALAPMSAPDSARVLSLLQHLPHGVAKMSERFTGKVQTSSNFAEVHTGPHEICFGVSNRSFIADELREMQQKVAELGQAAGARVQARDGYPGWEPRGESPLVELTSQAFQQATGHAPSAEVVHAGLECGLLSEKLPNLDAVSFGPLIRGAHTPEEWVSIPSVGTIYAVLTVLLAKLASK